MPIMSIEDKRDQLVEELIPFEDHLEKRQIELHYN